MPRHRHAGGLSPLAKFDQAVADGDPTVVYDDSGVKIYEYAGADEDAA